MGRVTKRARALARAMHAHQLCCGLRLEDCPVRSDLELEAILVIQDLNRLGYVIRKQGT